jgi:threonine/homoserine efflux transporter RhtA
MKFSKFVVVLVIMLNIVFAGVVLWIFERTKVEPVELVRCWFAFTTGELWFLATIKKAEAKKNDE